MSDKKHRRRERLRLEDEHEKAEALIRPRRRDQHINYRGAGWPVVQVCFWDSWQPLLCWEIRDMSGYSLFRSASQPESSDLLVGDQQLEIAPSILHSYVERLFGLSVPLGVPVSPIGVLDGSTYELCLYGGARTSCRLSWIGDHAPEPWSQMEAIVMEMVNLFQSLQPIPLDHILVAALSDGESEYLI